MNNETRWLERLLRINIREGEPPLRLFDVLFNSSMSWVLSPKSWEPLQIIFTWESLSTWLFGINFDFYFDLVFSIGPVSLSIYYDKFHSDEEL